MNVTLGVRAALLTLLVLPAFLLLTPVSAQTGETEVRISARNADDNEVEFALQQRDASGEWNERILPRRRFFPDVDHAGWLGSSVVQLERIEPSVNVRIIARKTASGSIEFGLQWAVPGTSWGEQIFPSLRFFPDVDHTRWLNSSAITIGAATAATIGDRPTRVFNALTSTGDGTGRSSAVTRYRLLAGERYAFSFGDRTTPTLLVPSGATVFHEFREFDHLETGYGAVLIFPSGLELTLHPDTVDPLLARTDITDPVALAIVESIRQSAEEERSAAGGPTPKGEYSLRAPYPTTPLDFGDGSYAALEGAGTITFQNQGRRLTLTLPPSDAIWLIVSLSTAQPNHVPSIYVVAAPEQWVAIAWRDGAEVDRLVNPGPGAAELHALYDAVAASVTN